MLPRPAHIEWPLANIHEAVAVEQRGSAKEAVARDGASDRRRRP
jgi:hypothetical protein